MLWRSNSLHVQASTCDGVFYCTVSFLVDGRGACRNDEYELFMSRRNDRCMVGAGFRLSALLVRRH